MSKKSPYSVQDYETAHIAGTKWEREQLTKDDWHWSKQVPGTIPLPDFIQMQAKGEAKIINGHVCLKKPGPDPELVELFKKRIADAEKQTAEMIAKNLYEGTFDTKGGLADLLKDDK